MGTFALRPGARRVIRAAALCLILTACASDAVVSPPTSTVADPAPVPTSAAPLATTSTTSTTVTIVPTTISPVTTLPPPELFHEGSPMIRFSVEVGDGIDLDRNELARFVVDTLGDGRSWIRRGAGFELVEEGGDFTMIVALPDVVDDMCAPLQTVGRFSCARNGWVAFNSLRWFGATDDWPADIETYRRYLVNHEVGHYIVGPGHDSCPGPGELAPIMMQQTKGLDGCEANGWVEPGPPE